MVSEATTMVKRMATPIDKDDHQPFIEECLPRLKLEFAYLWMNFQARKRKYFKKNQTKMPPEIMQKTKKEIECQLLEEKVKWARNLLRKLKKDIKPESRMEFIKAAKGSMNTECVVSNPDQKGKMRRIDCLRQADKVWRLDLVIMVLFHAAPLESTDGERLSRISTCRHKLCVNPKHLGLVAKGLDIYLSNNLLRQDAASSPNILLTGIFIKDQQQTKNHLKEKCASQAAYPSLGVFHKELPPVTIRINDKISQSKANEVAMSGDLNNNNAMVSTSPKMKPQSNMAEICVSSRTETQTPYHAPERSNAHNVLKVEQCGDSQNFSSEYMQNNPKLFKSQFYTSRAAGSTRPLVPKQRSFSTTSAGGSPTHQLPRETSFSAAAVGENLDLNQSIIYSYPQDGYNRNTQHQMAARGFQQQPQQQQQQQPSFIQQQMQAQQLNNSYTSFYQAQQHQMDFNSSCGSEISTTSMASFNSDQTLSNYQPSQQAMEYYHSSQQQAASRPGFSNPMMVHMNKPEYMNSQSMPTFPMQAETI